MTQTQSQYEVYKQPITYSHQIEDKFDRVVVGGSRNIATNKKKDSASGVTTTFANMDTEIFDLSSDDSLFNTILD